MRNKRVFVLFSEKGLVVYGKLFTLCIEVKLGSILSVHRSALGERNLGLTVNTHYASWKQVDRR